jgi:Rrf2 family transcriptional repressor of oqxAB
VCRRHLGGCATRPIRLCRLTNHSAEYFIRLTNETEAAVLGTLAGRTLADSLDALRAIDRADPGL